MEAMGMKAPRQEPKFEGDRAWREIRLAAEQEEALEQIRSTGKPSDYAQPDVRAMENVEAEIARLAATEIPQMAERAERTRSVGNSADMKKVQQMLNTSITAAHEDTCKTLDKAIEEARALLERMENAVETHKKMLKDEGLKVAVIVESGMQGLKRTVELVEKQMPDLLNPRLDAASGEEK
jgi:DNA anti-recombination protein RmuC